MPRQKRQKRQKRLTRAEKLNVVAAEANPARFINPDTGQLVAPTIQLQGEVMTQVRVPELKQLVSLPDEQLVELTQRFGMTPDTGQLLADAKQYVNRMTDLAPGSARFAEEASAVANDRGLRRWQKKLQRNYVTYSAVGGDPNQELIRIEEGDEPCDECDPRAGEIGTYAYHVELGLPGAPSCLGGDD